MFAEPRILYIAAFVLLLTGSSQAADTGPTMAGGEQPVYLMPQGVGVPVGYFLLIRKGNGYCALKLTESKPGKDKHKWRAEYETYYQGDAADSFGAKPAAFRRKKLTDLDPFYIARMHRCTDGGCSVLNFEKENRQIDCGEFHLDWSGERNLIFFDEYWPMKRKGRIRMEMAPTNWQNISDINVFDDRLKWYQYNDNRKETLTPVDNLWDRLPPADGFYLEEQGE